MIVRQLLVVVVVLPLLVDRVSAAEQIRYFQKDGVTYRETLRTVRRPITETQWRETPRTVYRQEVSTELRDSVRTRWVSVTECRCEAFWLGRWNPFVEPQLAYRWVPRTTWEKRTEAIKTPVTCRRLVPETQTVRTPVTTHRMVEEEVITRVAVRSRPSGSPLNTLKPLAAAGPYVPIGGIVKMENDPPRRGINTAWRAAGASNSDTVIRR